MENQAFYNTAGLTGNDLKRANNKALTENDIVLYVMQKLGEPCTSFEIYEYWTKNNLTERISPSLLQNIRRSLDNLEGLDKVVNTMQRRKGGFGISNYVWKLI